MVIISIEICARLSKNCTNCTRTFIGKLKIALRKDQRHFKNRQSNKGMITKYDIDDYTELCNTKSLWKYSGFILIGGETPISATACNSKEENIKTYGNTNRKI